MEEALQKLQVAEKENVYKKECLLKELTSYEEEKKQLLAKEKQLLKEEMALLLKEKEALEQKKLEEEKDVLQEKNNQLIEQLTARYDQNNEAAVRAIIERVRETYGRN
ncbi:hypothetical protein [Vagococcus xieshaowenii]|uniref:Uncharacterized protein n=1 Tax=Vagococcus xieshaowenii TaxID=2562451 RepID=A0AAJ5JQI5_9ENTE|nr:hypothetical protein [Vagococcus xieshaowenii]QCA29022.1 hypothetical protein E4Z98_06740 [Vagococcus xieshaowenii]TFZ41002.1 hypothetical protein E4031_06355 [Vagococcus xieshaowenii]